MIKLLIGALAVYMNRERQRELIPYVVATISATCMFFIFLMIQHMKTIPRELEEAAQTLGCSPARAFVRVSLPLALK